MSLAIVDYGSGNVGAIARLANLSDVACAIVQRPEELASARSIVLPGVGAFDRVAADLEQTGMRAALLDRLGSGDCRVLGICVGMQLLASQSEEGDAPGLGLVDGSVLSFEPTLGRDRVIVPHMGWNSIDPFGSDHPLFAGVDMRTGFYFLHSYYFSAQRSDDVIATSVYGERFPCAVASGPVIGVQFHPEKSHRNGVRLLRNFVEMTAC